MSYETVDPNGAKALIEDGWTYVDVRTVEEFERGHAVGAYNVPFAVMGEYGGMEPNAEFVAVMTKHFPTDSKLVLGCAAGGRSMHACNALAAAGYRHLANMHGGFSGARDMSGQVVQPGWAELGHSNTTEIEPDKTWEALRGS